jgi:hypothetical protein
LVEAGKVKVVSGAGHVAVSYNVACQPDTSREPPETFVNSMASGVSGFISLITREGLKPNPVFPASDTVSVNAVTVSSKAVLAVTVTGKGALTVCGEGIGSQSK